MRLKTLRLSRHQRSRQHVRASGPTVLISTSRKPIGLERDACGQRTLRLSMAARTMGELRNRCLTCRRVATDGSSYISRSRLVKYRKTLGQRRINSTAKKLSDPRLLQVRVPTILECPPTASQFRSKRTLARHGTPVCEKINSFRYRFACYRVTGRRKRDFGKANVRYRTDVLSLMALTKQH